MRWFKVDTKDEACEIVTVVPLSLPELVDLPNNHDVQCERKRTKG